MQNEEIFDFEPPCRINPAPVENTWHVSAIVYARPPWWHFSDWLDHQERVREMVFDLRDICEAHDIKVVPTRYETVILARY